MFRCVREHGGRRVWLTTVSPACWTPFFYRPMHVRQVWSLPACVRSVYGHVVFAVVVWLDLVRAGVLPVAVLVGASCVGLARYAFTVRRLPTVGEKSNDKWSDRCKNHFQIQCPFPCPALAV